MLYDERLLDDVTPSTTIHRARVLEFTLPQRALWRLGLGKAASTWVGLYFADQAFGWFPDAYRIACKVLAEERYHAVVSVGFPMASHLLGWRIADRFGLPWIADYKDEWTDNPYVVFPTPLHRKFAEALESRMLRRADRVLAVTDAFARHISSRAGDSKVFTLENGYDERHFSDDGVYVPNRRFTIGYVGSYYGMNSPADLFAAMESLVVSGRIPKERIRFVHVGMGRYEVPEALSSVVERRGGVSQREANRLMQTVELLTQTLPDPAPHSGKIFDYMRAGRPVLAVTPRNGMLAALLSDTHAGEAIEPGDVAGLAEALLRRYQAWERGDVYRPDMQAISRFEWARLAEKFVEHLEATVSAASRPATEADA